MVPERAPQLAAFLLQLGLLVSGDQIRHLWGVEGARVASELDALFTRCRERMEKLKGLKAFVLKMAQVEARIWP